MSVVHTQSEFTVVDDLICCNAAPPSELFSLDEGLTAWALGLGLSPKKSPEDRYLLSLASQYQVEHYQDSYGLMSEYRSR